MKRIHIPLPVFGFVVSTRAALGAGIGLLLADKLSAPRRRAIGATLVAVGAATTIPALFLVARGIDRTKRRREQGFVGATRFPRKGDDVRS